jgi:hypothetical protein
VKIALDESVPDQVRRAFSGHEVYLVKKIGWGGISNGKLLAAVETAGFDCLVIADKNLRYQQDLKGRRLAIIELWTNHRPTLENHLPRIAAAIEGILPGEYRVVDKP